MREARSTVEATAKLVELVYELLDAHDDTAQLAHELGRDVRWAAHLDYLQQLQRVGRELMATDTVVPRQAPTIADVLPRRVPGSTSRRRSG